MRNFRDGVYLEIILGHIKFLLGTITLLGLSVLPSISISADWFLDASAKGLNNGKNWNDAWPSVSKINWLSIVPGDTLWIQGGNYNCDLDLANKDGITVRISDNAISPAYFWGINIFKFNNSTIDGYYEDKPYIKSTRKYATLNNAVTIRYSVNVTLRGVEVDRSNEYNLDNVQIHCVQINGSQDNIVIENCELHHSSGDGINFTHPPSYIRDAYDSFIIRNNKIYSVGDDGIQNAMQASIYGNYIDKNGFPTLFGAHPDGYQSFSGNYSPSSNYKIFNNIIKGFNQNIFIEYTKGNAFIYNNILIGGNTAGTDRAINHSHHSTFNGTFLIANNAIINFRTYMGMNGILPSTAKVSNNIFLNCKYAGSVDVVPFLDNTNIFWDEPGTSFYDTNGLIVSAPNNRNAGRSLIINPKISAVPPYILINGSPAIGKGADMSIYFKHDYLNKLRVTPWDIGPNRYSDVPPAYPNNISIN